MDKRCELIEKLISKGCPEKQAWLIAVEAGGSQAIVDVDYLKELGLEGKLLLICKRLVQEFYLAELNLL